MGIVHLLFILPGLFLGSFLPWYFLEQPKRILTNYAAYSHAFLEILSIGFLLKTLFSPWKSIDDKLPSNLMDFEALGMAITLNITTRVIGFIFRSIALVTSLVIQLILLCIFLAYLILWLAYPGVLVAAIAFSLHLY